MKCNICCFVIFVVKIQWLFDYLLPFRINVLQTLLLENFVIQLFGFNCFDALVPCECEIIVQITILKCFLEQKIKLAPVFYMVIVNNPHKNSAVEYFAEIAGFLPNMKHTHSAIPNSVCDWCHLYHYTGVRHCPFSLLILMIFCSVFHFFSLPFLVPSCIDFLCHFLILILFSNLTIPCISMYAVCFSFNTVFHKCKWPSPLIKDMCEVEWARFPPQQRVCL